MDKYTYDDVMDAATELAEAFPRRTNPMISDGCVYTDKYRKRHCIAGQILINLGTDLCPTYRNFANRGTDIAHVNGVFELFEEPAVALLAKLQQTADGVGTPVPWGKAVAHVLNRG